MPGSRSSANGDAVSTRKVYRTNITAVDGVSIENSAIPVLDSAETPNKNLSLGGVNAPLYGRNAQLNLDVIMEAGVTSVTLQLFMEAPVEQGSPIAPGDLPATGSWVFVEEKVITKPEHWVIKDLPPGPKKVKVSAFAGAGKLHILEQHAA